MDESVNHGFVHEKTFDKLLLNEEVSVFSLYSKQIVSCLRKVILKLLFRPALILTSSSCSKNLEGLTILSGKSLCLIF